MRQALARQINQRDSSQEKVTGQLRPEAGVTPNNIPSYTAPKSLFEALDSSERQTKAKQLLAEAGYNQGKHTYIYAHICPAAKTIKKSLLRLSMWKPLGVKVSGKYGVGKRMSQLKERETISLLDHGHLETTPGRSALLEAAHLWSYS